MYGLDGFTPRDYQKKDIEFMYHHSRIINANEPGLGKTLETMAVCNLLKAKKILIISPSYAYGTWRKMYKDWMGVKAVIYTGNKKKRSKLFKKSLEEGVQIFIASYVSFPELSEVVGAWDAVIVDEYHACGIMNRKSISYKKLKNTQYTHLFLLTGTPVRKDLTDLYAPLHLLDPKKFSSYWGFREKHCIVWDGMYGQIVETRPKNPIPFKNMLYSRYMVRNRKKDVVKELPEKQRQIIPIELPEKWRKIYDKLDTDMYTEFSNDELVICPNPAVTALRKRQLLTTPKLLGADEYGVGLETLAPLVLEEFKSGRSVAIFTTFNPAVHIIEEYLTNYMKKHSINLHTYKVYGGMKDIARDVADKFQDDTQVESVIICTIGSSASFDAYKASTAFIIGPEVRYDLLVQAEDRIHRIGQDSDRVMIYFLIHENTVENTVINILKTKKSAQAWVVEDGYAEEKLSRILNKKHLDK